MIHTALGQLPHYLLPSQWPFPQLSPLILLASFLHKMRRAEWNQMFANKDCHTDISVV
jgi:hypothetical protein